MDYVLNTTNYEKVNRLNSLFREYSYMKERLVCIEKEIRENAVIDAEEDFADIAESVANAEDRILTIAAIAGEV